MKNLHFSGLPRSGAKAAWGIGAVIAALILAPVNLALACGCCSEVGQRYEGVNEIDAIEQDILQAIEFNPRAELMDFEDDAMGLIDLSADEEESSLEFGIASTVSPDVMIFDLSQQGKKRGTIKFPLPTQMTHFEVDTRDGIESEDRLGPALYREWRLTGEAELTGMATKGTHRTTVRLILQGRGISCPNLEDFTHWSLAVDGQEVQFRLIGALEK